MCGWRLREPFSRTTVSGLVSVSRVSVCEIRLMRESPWVACFFTPRPTLFVRSHGPTFLVRIWPPIVAGFRLCLGIARFLGRLGPCLCPGNGHTFWPTFIKKTGALDNKSQSIYQIYHTIATPWHGAISCVREGSRTGFWDSMCGQETRFMVSECTHKGAH